MTDQVPVPIRRGHVYWLPDTAVNFPPLVLNKDRKPHPRRPFLVMSGETNEDDSWPTVLGFPLSTAQEFTTEFDVALKAGQANLPEDCWVRVEMMQPIAKTKLIERLGQLDANVIDECMTRFLSYLGEI